MSENSVISAPTTPENANSSIHKPKSSVSNIILNTLSNSITKWFSPSDQNGNLRRKRESESDIELNDLTGTGAPTSEPPTKRFCSVRNQAKSPNAPFQFAGSSDVTNNPFAPQSAASNSAATAQRRKIRARRTTQR